MGLNKFDRLCINIEAINLCRGAPNELIAQFFVI